MGYTIGVSTFTSFEAGCVAYGKPNELNDVLEAQLTLDKNGIS